jgi:hypothetical protein
MALPLNELRDRIIGADDALRHGTKEQFCSAA